MGDNRVRIAEGDGYAVVEEADAEGNLKLDLEWAPGLKPPLPAIDHAFNLVAKCDRRFETLFQTRDDPDYETQAKALALFADAARRDDIKNGAAYRRAAYWRIARILLLLPVLKIRLKLDGRMAKGGYLDQAVIWHGLRDLEFWTVDSICLKIETENMGTLLTDVRISQPIEEMSPGIQIGFMKSDMDALDVTTLKAAAMAVLARDLVAPGRAQAYIDARLKQIYPDFYLLPGETRVMAD